MLKTRRWWRQWGPALIVGVLCTASPISAWWVSTRSPLNQPAATLSDQHADTHKSQTKSQDPWWQALPRRTIEDPVAFWTLWLMVFTGLLAFISMRQFKYIRRADHTAARSADAAIRSADAARDVANAAISAERPRLNLSRLTFGRFGGNVRDQSKIPIITVGFKNHGRTVAIVTDVRVCMKIADALPEHPEYGDRKIYVPVGRTVGVGEEYVLPPQWFFDFKPDETGTAGLPFKAHFWAFGYIAYRDHIGDERRHGFVGFWIPPDIGSPLGDASGTQFIWGGIRNYAYDT